MLIEDVLTKEQENFDLQSRIKELEEKLKESNRENDHKQSASFWR